ncbi:uncharacterized protein KY384_000326 [Bacidia gigantensis]|uniref:uncharacterized protein n=1 Tax=Bacidia gigantensis TaxID=2732470 RepID=UPI001D050500|nr:uncharacterized protein KY384_000326 [Bacidia gigantensis]KAG8526333.1 hypothetical protein KY384_000326 [Bacidia gigantensis]
MEPSPTTRLPSVSSLLSPPMSKPHDTFNTTPSKSPSTSYKREFTPDDKLAPLRHSSGDKMKTSPDIKMHMFPSPPVSPWQERLHKPERASQGHVRKSSDLKDPPLFAESETGSNNEEPLFHPRPVEPTDESITLHIKNHLNQFPDKFNKPRVEEYQLAVGFFSKIGIGSLYNRDPAAYLKRHREEEESTYYQTKRICAGPGVKAGRPVAIAPAPKPNKRAIKPITPKSTAPRVKRTPKNSPQYKMLDYEPKGRSTTPRQTGQKKEPDINYNAFKDYAPPPDTVDIDHHFPVDTIKHPTPLDLSNDPDRHLLREPEFRLASAIRLPVAQYLTQKRRIFQGRVEALQRGQEVFRKTNAQQACKVDVNKASTMWSGWEAVGWFDKHWFEQYKDDVIE